MISGFDCKMAGRVSMYGKSIEGTEKGKRRRLEENVRCLVHCYEVMEY